MVKLAAKEQATVAAVKERLIGTTGSSIDKLITLREKKRMLEEQIKELDTQSEALSELLIARMKSEGIDAGKGKLGSASITKSVVATVENWDAFHAYIAKTKKFHLLQRRVADAAWRELFESKGAIPGTSPFEKTKLNLRKAS